MVKRVILRRQSDQPPFEVNRERRAIRDYITHTEANEPIVQSPFLILPVSAENTQTRLKDLEGSEQIEQALAQVLLLEILLGAEDVELVVVIKTVLD